MGVISAVSSAGRVTRAIARATQEGHRLARASKAARKKLQLPHRKGAARHAALVDFPGLATGDELAIAKGSRVFGFDDVEGTVRINRLEPSVVELVVDGSIGPLGRRFEVELARLNETEAEFRLGGFGFKEPFLVRIEQSRKRLLRVMPHGGEHPVVLSAKRANELLLEFTLGDEHSRIVAARA